MVDRPASKKIVKPAPAKAVVKPVPVKAIAKPVVAAKPVVTPKPKVEAAKPAAAPATPKPVIQPIAAAKPPIPAPVVAPAPPVVEAAKPVEALVAAPAPVITPKAEPVRAPLIEEGKTIMTETLTQAQDTAKKFAADAQERATAMFGDVNARAKTALEKGSKAVEELVEFSKGNLEALAASGRVAAKGAEEIAKYTAEYGRSTVEKANANAKRFAAVKSPTEFFQLQSEVAKTSVDELVSQASKFSESYLKLLGEIVQPISNRYAVAAEKAKTLVAA